MRASEPQIMHFQPRIHLCENSFGIIDDFGAAEARNTLKELRDLRPERRMSVSTHDGQSRVSSLKWRESVMKLSILKTPYGTPV